jgi:hypothetical protein
MLPPHVNFLYRTRRHTHTGRPAASTQGLTKPAPEPVSLVRISLTRGEPAGITCPGASRPYCYLLLASRLGANVHRRLAAVAGCLQSLGVTRHYLTLGKAGLRHQGYQSVDALSRCRARACTECAAREQGRCSPSRLCSLAGEVPPRLTKPQQAVLSRRLPATACSGGWTTAARRSTRR